MELKSILTHVDHTLLKQESTWEQIKAICDDGIKFNTASVCIPPSYVKECAEFINAGVTAFQAVAEIKKTLIENGFEELKEGQRWNCKSHGRYFTTRNLSSIIAFSIGENTENLSFNICASHSDVCTFQPCRPGRSH